MFKNQESLKKRLMRKLNGLGQHLHLAEKYAQLTTIVINNYNWYIGDGYVFGECLVYLLLYIVLVIVPKWWKNYVKITQK